MKKIVRSKKVLALLAVPLMAMLAMGCTEKEAKVTSKSDSSTVVQEEETPAPEDEATEDAGEEPEVAETATLGDTVEVGDWSVKVDKVVLNANQVLGTEDLYNEKPKGQYVLVTYEATYQGAERTADAMADLTWTLTTTDQKIWDQALTSNPMDGETTEARHGGTIKHQVAFDVDPALLKGGILSVEGYDADLNSIYADFDVA